MASSVDELQTAGEEVGSAFVDGMIAGMDAKEEELRRKSRELAKIPETETRDGLEIRSPSLRGHSAGPDGSHRKEPA